MTSGEQLDHNQLLVLSHALNIFFTENNFQAIFKGNFSSHFQASHVSIYELTILQPMCAHCVCYLAGRGIEAWPEARLVQRLVLRMP